MKSIIHSTPILFALFFLHCAYSATEYYKSDQNGDKKILLDTLNKIEQHLEEKSKGTANIKYGNLDVKAWKRYKLFDRKIASDSPEEYLKKSKSYIKDSTQILLVKLKALETLDYKGLLEKDIQKNQDYYLTLIQEFRDSDLDPKYYLYFENKIREINSKSISAKYNTSLFFNMVCLFSMGVFGIVVFKRKNKRVGRKMNFLSSRERKVILLALEGKSNKEIASELFISLSTVKTHLTNSYHKLGVSNRKELIRNY